MRQLEPTHYGLQLRKVVDENVEWCVPALYEYMQEQASACWDCPTIPMPNLTQPRLASNSVLEDDFEIPILLPPHPVCLEYKCILCDVGGQGGGSGPGPPILSGHSASSALTLGLCMVS